MRENTRNHAKQQCKPVSLSECATKITNFDALLVMAHQNVVWLQIRVDDAQLVQEVQSGKELLRVSLHCGNVDSNVLAKLFDNLQDIAHVNYDM